MTMARISDDGSTAQRLLKKTGDDFDARAAAELLAEYGNARIIGGRRLLGPDHG